MNLTLDDIKNEWLARDRQLETSLRMNTLLLRETLLDKHSTRVGRATTGSLFQILFKCSKPKFYSISLAKKKKAF